MDSINLIPPTLSLWIHLKIISPTIKQLINIKALLPANHLYPLLLPIKNILLDAKFRERIIHDY